MCLRTSREHPLHDKLIDLMLEALVRLSSIVDHLALDFKVLPSDCHLLLHYFELVLLGVSLLIRNLNPLNHELDLVLIRLD